MNTQTKLGFKNDFHFIHISLDHSRSNWRSGISFPQPKIYHERDRLKMFFLGGLLGADRT